MRKNRYLSAIDLGSSRIRALIAEPMEGEGESIRVIGVGEAPSFGMRKGAISDGDSLAKSISEAVEQAETMAGSPIREAAVSISGANVKTQTGKGVIAVGRTDGEVTPEDVERVISSAGKADVPLNYEIIHIIPRSFRLDDQSDIVDPVGMQGVRLEVDALVVLGFLPQIKHTQTILSSCGVSARQFIFAPLAAAESTLDRQQKELGAAVVDFGGMTTSVAVYEEGELLHCASFGVGSAHITNDIAIGLRTSVELAERVKTEYGTANTRSIDRDEDIRLSMLDPSEDGDVSRYHVGEIIEARLEEMFESAEKELKSIDRDYLLPSGVALTGGGACLPEIVDMAKAKLSLPVSIGYPRSVSGVVDKVDNPAYAVAAGLIFWQLRRDEVNGGFGGGFSHSGMSKIFAILKHWFKTFLP